MSNDLVEEMARAIREEQVRQYRDNDRANCPAGAAFYEENVGPYALAQAAYTIAQGRIEALEAALKRALNFIENTESEYDIELGCGDIARAALNLKGERVLDEARAQS